MLMAVAVIVLVGVVVVVVMQVRSQWQMTKQASAEQQVSAQPKTTVKLSQDKIRSANLHIAPCQIRELRDVRIVPGRINYDEAHRLRIQSPAAGLINEVLVAEQQRVAQGTPLAILTSEEIGLARDAVAQCKTDLALAQKEAERSEQVSANLTELLNLLKQRPDPSETERQFDDKVLGSHREQIISAYSKLFLAESIAKDTATLDENGTLSRRVVQERRSNREIAKAEFLTACEQSTFAVAQDVAKSRANVEHAERLLAVSRQKLQSLGDDSDDSSLPSGNLSELTLKAPFEGVIQERMIVPSARVMAADPLFVLADTEKLWVSAEIPTRDWQAVNLDTGRQLIVQAPSLPGSDIVARVNFTEGKISAETNTLTIVGELDNRAASFRPGMFVWVSIPMGQPRRVLAVPAGAIVQHEGLTFVFVAQDENTFHRVDVTTGTSNSEWIEITSGLTEGQNIVDGGTFLLKSELLLEHESG